MIANLDVTGEGGTEGQRNGGRNRGKAEGWKDGGTEGEREGGRIAGTIKTHQEVFSMNTKSFSEESATKASKHIINHSMNDNRCPNVSGEQPEYGNVYVCCMCMSICKDTSSYVYMHLPECLW